MEADMNKVAVVNLGCPKNQIDAETMSGLLQGHGYEITHLPQQAKIIIVNTCGFIDKARQESIEQILAMAQYKESGLCQKLIVTGCLSQGYFKELEQEIPEVDAFLGTGNVDKILDVIGDGKSRLVAPDLYDGQAEGQRLYSTFPYGYLKIAEGCNNWCSYCVIPRLRGRLRSKDKEQIYAEVRRMVQRGIQEIVLIAQDISQYGLDLSGKSELASLLMELEEIDGVRWLRLLYCYPDHIDDQLMDVLAGSNKIVPYLDIPLQHSHPDILKSMGRQRGALRERELIETLRHRIPNIALRTTFIVGYPGEEEEHFQHLLDFVRWAKFDQMGAFMYSREKGTPAAELPDQVPAQVAQYRYHQLMQAQQDIVFARNHRMVGEKFLGLVDGVEGSLAVVRTYREAPEIDSVVLVDADNLRPGTFVNIRCIGYEDYDLLGVIE